MTTMTVAKSDSGTKICHSKGSKLEKKLERESKSGAASTKKGDSGKGSYNGSRIDQEGKDRESRKGSWH